MSDPFRWPNTHLREGRINSKRRRLRNTCDMVGVDRYGGFTRGFVNGEMNFLTGKQKLFEGQQSAGISMQTSIHLKRSVSPVNMKVISPAARLTTVTEAAAPTAEYHLEKSFIATKPTSISYSIPQSPRESKTKCISSNTNRLQEVTDHQSSYWTTTSMSQKSSPFSLAIGRCAPQFFQIPIAGKDSLRPKQFSAKEDDVDYKPIQTEKEREPTTSGIYWNSLRDVNSVADYYDVAKMWEKEEPKETTDTPAGRVRKQGLSLTVSPSTAKLNGGGSSGEADDGSGCVASMSNIQTEVEARAAAFAKLGWRDTAAGDKEERLRRRRIRGHDFAISSGRSSPLFFSNVPNQTDLQYNSCSHHPFINLGSHGKAQCCQPLGRVTGRQKPINNCGLDVNRLLSKYKNKYRTLPECNFDLTVNKEDDIVMNPSSLTININKSISEVSWAAGPSMNIGMHTGRHVETLGTLQQRTKMKKTVAPELKSSGAYQISR